MAKRKIIKNYEGKRKNERGSIFKYVGKTKTTYGYILELPKSPDGKRNKVEKGGYNTEFEAVLAKRNLEKTTSGISDGFTNYTLSSYYKNIYLPHAQLMEISTSSLKQIKLTVDRFIEMAGDKKIVEISKVDYINFQKYLKTVYDLTNSSINTYCGRLKTILNHAVSQDVLTDHRFKGDDLKTRGKEVEPYTKDEIEYIIDFIHTRDDVQKYYIPVIIALYTGARANEILALKWEDVNLEKEFIEINKSLEVNDEGEYVLGPTKNGKARTVGINKELKKILLAHKYKQKENRLKYGAEYVTSDFVCTTKHGYLVNYGMLSTLRLSFKSRGFSFGMHRFRKTFATNAVKANINPKVLQEILGHSDIKTTMKYYVNVDSEQKIDAANIIADYIIN